MHTAMWESTRSSRRRRNQVISFAVGTGLVALLSCTFTVTAIADGSSAEGDNSAALSLIDAIGNQAQQNEAASQPDEADFEYNDHNGLCSITGYTGPLTNVVAPSSLGGKPVMGVSDTVHVGGTDTFLYESGWLSAIPNQLMLCAASEGMIDAVIPGLVDGKPVGSITFEAFLSSNIQTVDIPGTVKQIYISAFEDCRNLTTVNVAYGLEYVDSRTFANDVRLSAVVLPSTVTWIANDAFEGCDWSILTIYGVEGSFAQQYAEEHGIMFYAVEPKFPSELVCMSGSNGIGSAKLVPGSGEQLVVCGNPSSFNQPVSWKSSDTSVVTVDDKGYIKGIAEGTAIVKATCGDASVTFDVEVCKPVTAIFLNAGSVTLGSSSPQFQLEATVVPGDAGSTEIEWFTQDPFVAVVDEAGLVHPIGVGSTMIGAKACDGSEVYIAIPVTVTSVADTATSVDELQSEHPYSEGQTVSWVYQDPETSSLLVTFDERTEVEQDFDFICIYDIDGALVGYFTGTELAGQTIQIDSAGFSIELVSDESGTAWGFAVTSIEAS